MFQNKKHKGVVMDIETIEQFFFEMMPKGWISGKTPQPIPGLPLFKGFIFSRGGLTLTDAWTTNQATKRSFGFTIIQESQTLWFMTYGGTYPNEVISLVKEACDRAYDEKVFYGGRGSLVPLFTPDGRLKYDNNFEGNFSFFTGEESVIDNNNNIRVGWHQYFGMSLLGKQEEGIFFHFL